MDDLTPEESREVVRRAAEIDGVGDIDTEGAVSAELVEAAAVEAGISRSAIERAMQEQGLVRALGRSRQNSIVLDLAVGPERVSSAVESYLTEAGFAPVARGPDVAIWEPGGGGVTRGARRLVGVSRVTVSVTRGDAGGSTVAANLDGRQRRLLHVGAASAGGAVMGVGGWAAVAGAWPMTVFVGGAGLALAISQIREATALHRRRLAQAIVGLENFLSGLEDLAEQREVNARGPGLSARLDTTAVRTTSDSDSGDIAGLVELERPDMTWATSVDGTVTLAFTDIKASTELNERIGDEDYFELIREHDALVRTVAGQHRGSVVKSAGDGHMLAFSSARGALEFAVDLQRRIAGGTSRHGVCLRIGLHTGEPMRERDDFYGRDVAFAARICAAAEGGEILVSALVRSLVGPSRAFQLEPPRGVELKGFDEAHQVYPVRWSDSS